VRASAHRVQVTLEFGEQERVIGAERIGEYRFTRWVTASDMLALSLLQARLIDLKLPIKIEEGA
jgi:hypothetical protein